MPTFASLSLNTYSATSRQLSKMCNVHGQSIRAENSALLLESLTQLRTSFCSAHVHVQRSADVESYLSGKCYGHLAILSSLVFEISLGFEISLVLQSRAQFCYISFCIKSVLINGIARVFLHFQSCWWSSLEGDPQEVWQSCWIKVRAYPPRDNKEILPSHFLNSTLILWWIMDEISV